MGVKRSLLSFIRNTHSSLFCINYCLPVAWLIGYLFLKIRNLFFFIFHLVELLIKAFLIAPFVKNLCPMQETLVRFLGRKDPLEKDRLLPTPVFLGFPCGSAGKESACNVGHLGLIPGLGRSPGEGKGYPLQYSGLENSMDCIDHGVSDTTERLSV